MSRRTLFLVFALGLLALAACNLGVPDSELFGWCYTYDFTANSYGFSFVYGSWQEGVGLVPDATYRLSGGLIHDQEVYPSNIAFTLDRILGDPPPDPIPTLNLTGTAEIFGITTGVQSGTLPEGIDTISVNADRQFADQHSNTINATIQGSANYAIREVKVFGSGESPFPLNLCEDAPTETPTPFIATDAPTGQLTPSETPTGTPTPTHTPTPTPDFGWCYTFDFRTTRNGWNHWANYNFGVPISSIWSAGLGFNQWSYYGTYRASAGTYGFGYYMPATTRVTRVNIFYNSAAVRSTSFTDVIFGSDGDSDPLPAPAEAVTYNGPYITGGFVVFYDLTWGIWGGYDYTVGISADLNSGTTNTTTRIYRVDLCGDGADPGLTPDPTSTPTNTPTPSHTPTPTATGPTPTYTPWTVTPIATPTGTPSRTPSVTPYPIYQFTLPPLATLPPPITPGNTSTPDLTLTAQFYETGTAAPGPGPTAEFIIEGEGGPGEEGGIGDVGEIGRAVFGFGFNAMNRAAEWIGQIRNVVGIAVTAWNVAAPKPIPYLPNCIGDARLLSELCAIYYILTYTVFSEPIGNLLIPIGEIIFGLVILWVTIYRARAIAQRIGEIRKQ